MKMHKNTKRVCLMLLLGSALLAGCSQPEPVPCPVPGNPEAVLAGNWSLTTDGPSDLPPTTLTFDGNGKMTNISFNLNGVIINQQPVSGCTQVNGMTVNISQNLTTSTNMGFMGTLNDDYTKIRGSLVATLALDNTNIILGGVPATLARQ